MIHKIFAVNCPYDFYGGVMRYLSFTYKYCAV